MAVLDIVIPCHDRPDWLKLCVQAIRNWTRNDFRAFLVNNASKSSEAKEFFEQIRQDDYRFHVLDLAENKSFSNAVNAGAALGDSPFLFIMNSDIVVVPGWDTAMIQELADPKVGIVGAQSSNVSPPQSLPPDLIQSPGALNFTLVGMRRSLYEEVGPLDEETFDGFGSEDLDYSIRTVDKGYKLKVSRAWVYHGGSQTIESVIGGEVAQNQNNAKYLQRLISKHGRNRYESVVRSCMLPKVAVASMSSEEWTRVAFMEAMIALSTKGPYAISYMHTRRQMPNQARQALVDTARRAGLDYILMIDDDQIPPPDLLRRLIAHGKDVVGVVVYQRLRPYLPCVFDVPGDWTIDKARKGEYKHDMLIKSGCVAPKIGCERQGLQKVDSIGFGAILMKLSIFDKIDKYIESGKDPRFVEKGRWFGAFEGIGEDLYFCTLARAAGVDIHCDTDVIVPHVGDGLVIDEAFKREFERQQALNTASKLD